jgi:hypothetical protein
VHLSGQGHCCRPWWWPLIRGSDPHSYIHIICHDEGPAQPPVQQSTPSWVRQLKCLSREQAARSAAAGTPADWPPGGIHGFRWAAADMLTGKLHGGASVGIVSLIPTRSCDHGCESADDVDHYCACMVALQQATLSCRWGRFQPWLHACCRRWPPHAAPHTCTGLLARVHPFQPSRWPVVNLPCDGHLSTDACGWVCR